MQRLHVYYACMILWKVFKHPEHPEHTVSVLVPVIPKHSKILIRLMEEITTWDENKPGEKRGRTTYQVVQDFVSWTVGFKKWWSQVGHSFWSALGFGPGAGSESGCSQKDVYKTFCFFLKGAHSMQKIEMIGVSLGNSWYLSVCWHLTVSVFSDALPARYSCICLYAFPVARFPTAFPSLFP